ncbi:MAG: methyl-accepting chemotaxis protein [Magnetococcales bacterium]|nr:methyl-accepting chemotaxis protein [Magnetococcales bacterium]
MKLSRQLMLLFLFLGIQTLGLGLFGLHMHHRLESRLAKLDREDIPLALAVSEASRQQLDQVLHINEALLFGELEERGKFETANEGFVSAGRRLNNVLVEARYLAQKGVESARLDEERLPLEQVKTIISDFQKTHADFEHLAGNIIRSIYKYRFLTKANLITGNGNQSLAEAEQEHLKNLGSNISSLDDETKRLETKLKQAFDATKALSRNLGTEAYREHYMLWVAFVVLMTLFILGGLFLLLPIHSLHLGRLRQHGEALENLAKPFRKKADFLLHSVQQIGSTFVHLISNDDNRQESMRAMASALSLLDGSAADSLRLAENTGTLARETHSTVDMAAALLAHFQEMTQRTVALCEQMQRSVQILGSATLQVNLLATSASAEASRKESSRGFSIFTDEIKGLSQTIIQTIEGVLGSLEDARKEMKNSQEDINRANAHFVGIQEGARQVTEWTTTVKNTAQRQTELVNHLQGELAALRDMATANYHMIQQSSIANHTLAEQTEAIGALIQSILVLVEERRDEHHRHLMLAEAQKEAPVQ